MKKDWNVQEYQYKGYYIYKITRRDYCVYNETGCIIDETTLKGAKAKIEEIYELA